MMKRFVAPMAAAMLLAGGAAFAQSTPPGAASGEKASTTTTKTQQSSSAMRSGAGMDQMTSDKLLDMKVVNSQGDKIGDVENLVVNPQSGQVSEVVVSVGGFLGIGDKKVALPWSQMQINQDAEQLITQASKEQLQQAQAWHDPAEQQARTPESRSGGAPPAATSPTATPPSGGAGSGTR